MKEFFLKVFINAGAAAWKMYLKILLQNIETHNNRQVYENTLKSLNGSFGLLAEVAKKTATDIDDTFIVNTLAAVTESASEDGVSL